MLKRLLSLRWVLTTLLVIAAVAVMIRLGIWQLDRLEQRRAFNARVSAQQSAPMLDLNQDRSGDLVEMEYRAVTVSGEYDDDGELVVRNQVWEDQPGVHILTPLKIDGSDEKVLVDRGWVPLDDFNAGDLSQYRQPGRVTVSGIIRRSQPRADFGGVPDPTYTPGQPRLDAVNLVSIERIQYQVEGKLLPVYIQQAPDGGAQSLPYRALEAIELTEGPHMGYAVQWFTFAAILALGYPFFVRKSLAEKGPASNGRSHLHLEDAEPLMEVEQDGEKPVN